MKTIYRYELGITDVQTLDLPAGATVLSVARSDRVPYGLSIWAKVETTNPTLPRDFFVVGTGNPVPAGLMDGPFIGTVQTDGLVWHLFEEKS